MFESFDFKAQKEEECEECLARDFLVDAIIDGEQKKICRRCLVASGAIELKKPGVIQLDAINRPSVREAMFRASGMMPKPIQSHGQPKLEDLRERYEEVKRKRAAEQEKLRKEHELLQIIKGKQEKPKVLDSTEFVRYMESQPAQPAETKEREIQQSLMIQQTPQVSKVSQIFQPQPPQPRALQPSQPTLSKKDSGDFDFSIETTRHTRIRDLLEKMKRVDEESEAREKEKISKTLARKMEEKMEGADSAGYEEKI